MLDTSTTVERCERVFFGLDNKKQGERLVVAGVVRLPACRCEEALCDLAIIAHDDHDAVGQ